MLEAVTGIYLYRSTVIRAQCGVTCPPFYFPFVIHTDVSEIVSEFTFINSSEEKCHLALLLHVGNTGCPLSKVQVNCFWVLLKWWRGHKHREWSAGVLRGRKSVTKSARASQARNYLFLSFSISISTRPFIHLLSSLYLFGWTREFL